MDRDTCVCMCMCVCREEELKDQTCSSAPQPATCSSKRAPTARRPAHRSPPAPFWRPPAPRAAASWQWRRGRPAAPPARSAAAGGGSGAGRRSNQPARPGRGSRGAPTCLASRPRPTRMATLPACLCTHLLANLAIQLGLLCVRLALARCNFGAAPADSRWLAMGFWQGGRWQRQAGGGGGRRTPCGRPVERLTRQLISPPP